MNILYLGKRISPEKMAKYIKITDGYTWLMLLCRKMEIKKAK